MGRETAKADSGTVLDSGARAVTTGIAGDKGGTTFAAIVAPSAGDAQDLAGAVGLSLAQQS